MALGKTTAFQTHAFAIMLVVMAGSVACGPASAQYWGDSSSGGWGGWGWGGRSSGGGWGEGYRSDRYYRRSPQRDFLSPFSSERRNRPAPAVDYSKAPPPRKMETPPRQTVVVIGDSMADWLGYGLDENYAEQPEIGVERKIRATSGLVRLSGPESFTSTFGTALLMKMAILLCKDRISRVKSGGCVLPTVCILPRPEP